MKLFDSKFLKKWLISTKIWLKSWTYWSRLRTRVQDPTHRKQEKPRTITRTICPHLKRITPKTIKAESKNSIETFPSLKDKWIKIPNKSELFQIKENLQLFNANQSTLITTKYPPLIPNSKIPPFLTINNGALFLNTLKNKKNTTAARKILIWKRIHLP